MRFVKLCAGRTGQIRNASNLYYYSDRHGYEIDIIAGIRDSLELYEIRSSQTFTGDFLRNLR